MRKLMILPLVVLAFVLPIANGVAAAKNAGATAAERKKIVTKKYTGDTVNADRWGTVQVIVTVRTTTTTGGKKKVVRRYTDLGGSYTYHTGRSQFIMSQSLPMLRQEFLTAQSADVQMISGATYTSQAFEQSLQSALSKVAG